MLFELRGQLPNHLLFLLLEICLPTYLNPTRESHLDLYKFIEIGREIIVADIIKIRLPFFYFLFKIGVGVCGK